MRNHRFLIPLLAVALAAFAATLAPVPERAQAAACPGADKGPRKISSKTAAKVVVCLINEKRKKRGMGGFDRSADLSKAARSHSKQMQRVDCFDHVCPGERTLVGRFERSRYLPCACSWGAAENIAWGPGRKGTPRKIVKAWMHSPEHRSNILGSYEHIGAGVRWGSPRDRSSKAGTYTVDFGYKR